MEEKKKEDQEGTKKRKEENKAGAEGPKKRKDEKGTKSDDLKEGDVDVKEEPKNNSKKHKSERKETKQDDKEGEKQGSRKRKSEKNEKEEKKEIKDEVKTEQVKIEPEDEGLSKGLGVEAVAKSMPKPEPPTHRVRQKSNGTLTNFDRFSSVGSLLGAHVKSLLHLRQTVRDFDSGSCLCHCHERTPVTW